MAAKAYRVIQEPHTRGRFTKEEVVKAIREVMALPQKDLVPVSTFFGPKKRRVRAKR